MPMPPSGRRTPVALAFAFALAGATAASAQVAPPAPAYAVRQWTTADGLPQSGVTALARDGEGNLWVGTNLGLARFDGDTFVAVPREGTSPPEVVRALAADGDGRILAAWPDAMLSRVDRAGGIVPLVPRGPQTFFHIVADADDTIWLATEAGVRRVAGADLAPLPVLPDGAVQQVRALLPAPGGVWVAGHGGLVRASGGALRRAAGLRCTRIAALAPAPPGGVWVATCAGLEYVDAATMRAVAFLPSPRRDLWPVQLEPDGATGALWWADEEYLRRVVPSRDRDGSWRFVSDTVLALQGAQPLALLDDGSDGVWLGTNAIGLFHVQPQRVRRLTRDDGLPERPVHHLAPDGRGGLWIGTCGGLARWRDGRIEVADTARFGLRSRCIKGLLRDADGGLWVGQLGALVRVGADGVPRTMLADTGAPLPDMAAVLQDRRGRVWFANDWGRVGYFAGPDASPVLVPAASLPKERVMSLAEDATGAIWVGQTGTLTRLADTAVTLRLTVADGLPRAPIRALHFDRDGEVWAATYGAGLVLVQPGGRVHRVPTRVSAAERYLSSLTPDAQGRFWFVGDGGVLVVPRAALLEAIASGRPPEETVVLGPEDGVPEGNGGFPSRWLDAVAGRLWFATVDGVGAIALADVPFARETPGVFIDDVRLDGAPVAVADSVRVPRAVNAVEIWLSAPHAGVTAPVVRYRLEGRDREWVPLGTPRRARFADLPPGRYVFTARAGWPGISEAAAERRLVLLVPAFWWETAWARALGIALGVALVWALVRALTRRARERSEVLQREIAERRRAEARAAASASELAHMSRVATAGELATSIAHELNQPLAAVMSGAQRARRLAEAGRTEELRPALESVMSQSMRAADVIRSLRAFVAKQGGGLLPLALETVVAETLRLLAHELAGRGVAVEVADRRRDRRPVVGNAVQLQQVLVNLLLNSADALAGAGPGARRVQVVLADEPPDMVRVSVCDRGTGMTSEELQRMFDPFFTTKPGGLGLGLSLSRSIVESHGGRLSASSSPEGGTTVDVLLPLAGA